MSKGVEGYPKLRKKFQNALSREPFELSISFFDTRSRTSRCVLKCNKIWWGSGGSAPVGDFKGRSPLDVRHVPNTEMKTYFSPKTAFKG